MLNIPVNYLARLKIDTPRASWAETYAYSMNLGIIAVIAILLIAAFIEIRLRIVMPLVELKNALEQNYEIDLTTKKSLFQEIRYLIQSYNQYRTKNQELTSQLRHSAITDPLTGLYNRSAIDTIYSKLLAVARRNNRLLALAFIDLDHFKEYNHLYGHQLGDDALIALSDVIKETFRRPTDAGVRFGGEEFLVFFDSEDFADARTHIKRLIGALKDKAIKHEGNSSSELLTMSVGLAVIKPNMDIELNKLINISDEAVYQAKLQGRNNTVARNLAED
jgi:diguanylate cyclase (GGDEF)-like protein